MHLVRILYLSQYYPPEMGAPSARVSQLARLWAAEGHDVTVLTGFPNHPTGVIPPEYRGRPYIRREEDHGVHVVRAPIYATANRRVIRRGLNYVSYAASASAIGPFLGQPDVVIGTSPQFLTAVAACWVAQAKRVPFVFEVRDLWPQSIVDVGAMSANSPVIKGLTVIERFLYRHADLIVSVTDGFVDEMAAKGVPRERMAVVKNGVDLSLFTPGPRDNEVRRKLGFQDKFLVSYIGTHGMSQGLGTVLDAAVLLRDDPRIQFVFLGEGAMKESLVRRAKDEGIRNILFLGQVPHREIPSYVQASDVTLVPLRKLEIFKATIPSKIFEFLGAARPIVIAVDGEAREIVESSGGGLFVPPEDSARMAEALRMLAADPANCEEMGRRGRAYVEQNFSRTVLARKYLDLLAGVVSAARPLRTSEPAAVERAA